MGAASGMCLRGAGFLVRTIQFCCAAIVLAIFSYFLATLNNHGMPIGIWVRVVEGISGVGVVYTILTFLTLCCCAGRRFPSFIMMVMDVLFIAGFIYIAIVNRGGASSCSGKVNTVYGTGNADTNTLVDTKKEDDGFTSLPSLRQACKMETASLAVSIIAALLFALSPLLNIAQVRHRRKEQRYGPSPANDYTSGYGPAPPRKGFNFFGLGRKHNNAAGVDQNPNALPQHTSPEDVRTSYATDATRVGSSGGAGYGGLGGANSKYDPSPYGNGGNDIPMGRFGNAGTGYDNNGGVYR